MCESDGAVVLRKWLRQLLVPDRLTVRNMRTPRSSPHECSSEFSVLPSQTSSSQFTSNLPRNKLILGTRAHTASSETGKPASVAVVSQHFVERPAVWPHMEPAVAPTTMSNHPADKWVICIQSASCLRSVSRHHFPIPWYPQWRDNPLSNTPARFPACAGAASLLISATSPKWSGRIAPKAHLRLSLTERLPSPGSLSQLC